MKVALSQENKASKGYGFVYFETEEACVKARQTGNVGDIEIIEFRQKTSEEQRKVFRNLVLHGLTESDTAETIKAEMSKFGEIESTHVKKSQKNEQNHIGFVLFKEPDSAQKAYDALKDTPVGQGKRAVIFKNKSTLNRELFMYKKSKSRCNLCVRGLPAETTE